MEQLRQFNNLSSWKENDYIIESGELKTIDFIDTAPNTFILQNPNGSNLYVSIGGIPTVNNYETKIESNSVKTFGRPTSTRKLYILNNGTRDVKIKIFSIFMKDFDINTLKYTEIDIASATIQSNSFISGFSSNASLPSGTNTIGKVGLENSVSNTLNTINNNLSEEKQQTTFIKNLTNQILESCSNMGKTLGVSADCYPQYENKVSSLSIDNYEGRLIIVHFSYLFNDGCDIDVKVGSDTILTIYSGEQLGDLEIDVPTDEKLNIVKSSTTTAEDTVNIRCKYYTY